MNNGTRKVEMPRRRLELDDLCEYAYETGTGRVRMQEKNLLLLIGANDGHHYSNAQVDDYHKDGVMPWHAPVQLSVRARFSHGQTDLHGTAGFGFWNDPFGMTEIEGQGSFLRRYRLPQAIWFFFASPPSNMPLALDVPGFGWKAATLDASTPLAKALLPLTPIGMLACRWQWSYRRLWPLAQRVLKVGEAQLPVEMDAWHLYQLEWGSGAARYIVDGIEVLRAHFSPRGPLGFVMWIDNQFMVATPQGNFRHGVLATDEQWMEIGALEVKAL